MANSQIAGRLRSPETWGWLLGGALAAAFGIKQRSWRGAALAGTGGYLVYSGLRGSRPLSEVAQLRPRAVRVSRTVTINRSPDELYRTWSNFREMPRFFTYLKSVEPQTGGHSHWVMATPVGKDIEWDAAITSEQQGELLAWRSLPNATVRNAGVVRFKNAPQGRGTEVQFDLDYRIPAGRLAGVIAGVFGEDPEQVVREGLRRFKQFMETGEIATTEGQPHGPRSPLARVARIAHPNVVHTHEQARELRTGTLA